VPCGKTSLRPSAPQARQKCVFAWLYREDVLQFGLEHNLGMNCDPIESFTAERLRLAKLLAIPAAVAIHSARLYEWARIYAAERQTLLKKADLSCSLRTGSTVRLCAPQGEEAPPAIRGAASFLTIICVSRLYLSRSPS
jgi:hypothetical protein